MTIQEILKKNINSVNSFLDKVGNNRFMSLVLELEKHERKRVAGYIDLQPMFDVVGGYLDMELYDEAKKHFEVLYQQYGDLMLEDVKGSLKPNKNGQQVDGVKE